MPSDQFLTKSYWEFLATMPNFIPFNEGTIGEKTHASHMHDKANSYRHIHA
jgi:hypothetical protein